MITFCKDVDILKWEPALFRDLVFNSQIICKGSDGVVNGTTFTSQSASFESSHVAVGHVIYLQNQSNAIDGCYEIVSVDSDMQLTISVVRVSSEEAAIPPSAGTEIEYRISTFDPQSEEAAYSLAQYFGLEVDGDDESIGPEDIVNTRSLRQCSVFAVLSVVFASYAIGDEDPSGYWEKSRRYRDLYQEARVKARVNIDLDGDEKYDQMRVGGVVRLKRL